MPYSEKDIQSIISKLVSRVNDTVQRIRFLEQNIKSVEGRVQGLEKDMNDRKKDLGKAASELGGKIDAAAKRTTELQATVQAVSDQSKKMATKADIITVKETLSIYDPFKSNFITKDEVERMMEERKSRKN